MKRTEQAAGSRRSVDWRLSHVQALAHVGDWEWDLESNVVCWSDELYRIYGFAPHEIVPDYDFVVQRLHPESKAEFQRAIDAALKGEKSFEMDYAFYRRDGREAFLHVIGEVIRNESGAPVRMVGIVQDITKRRCAEEDLRVQSQRLAESQRIAHIGSWEHNLETNRVFWSDELFRLFGLDPEKDKGDFDLFFGMVHPDDQPLLKKSIKDTLESRNPFNVDYRFIRPDGTIRFLRAMAELVADGSGKLVVLSGTAQDVTERKIAEDRLYEKNTMLQTLLNTVDEGFIVVDRDYRIHSANRAYCDQVGLHENQAVGRYCFEVSHRRSSPCHEEGEECCVKEVFARGEPYITHHRHEDADGNIIYVETKGFPLLDASGVVTRAIETVSDITEKRLLEDERLKVQKLEAIGTLAGGIAHDFNNLLQGVFGYISMAKLNSRDNQKAFASLEEAERALQLTVRMTNQLLTFSKGGKPVVKPTDLRAVIDNAVRFSLSGSSVHCRISHAEDLRHVEADEGQITQVVQNIVLNAVQAIPAGGKVEISTRNLGASASDLPGKPDNKHYVEVAIHDSGTGIRQEDLVRIFDPYFTTKASGSGLGLATSYSIVKNHGGWIKVDSRPGEGTTFTIYLPAAATCCIQAAPRAAVCEPGRPGKILVMDDEPMICQIAGGLINMLGHEVDYGSNGEEALAKYLEALQAGKPFDAVILDLTVKGGMGGAETVRKLRSVDPGVKAVVSSGYADSDIVANYREHGFMAVLNKPYDVTALQNVLNEILSSGAPGEN